MAPGSVDYEHELVQVLAQKGIQDLPSQFLQHVDEPIKDGGNIWVIDMGALTSTEFRTSELEKLCKACKEWGFFQVINHGVSSVMDIKKAARDFFHLPPEMKAAWRRQPGHMFQDVEGYGRYNTTSDCVFDWVDVLTMFTEPSASKNINKWPSMMRETTQIYSDEIKEFALKMYGALSETLGLPAGYIESVSGEYSSGLRVNYYPPCPQPDRVLGVGPHSDGGTITVLVEDSCYESLQVRKDGNWVALKALPDALIVNAGDMLQVLSNGLYPSVEHRAVLSEEHDRVSAVMFCYPSMNPNVRIQPAEKLLSEETPAIYRSVNYCEYLTNYLGKRAPGKARVDSLLIS